MSDSPGQIVVMDDSWLILEKIRESLALAGYQVRTTTSLEVAAKLAKSCDLAVIDFHMPGINGKEVLEHIKKTLPVDSTCQFYLYTSDPEQASRYRLHGFDGAFLKKGNEAALTTQVDAVFRTISLRKIALRMRRERRQA